MKTKFLFLTALLGTMGTNAVFAKNGWPEEAQQKKHALAVFERWFSRQQRSEAAVELSAQQKEHDLAAFEHWFSRQQRSEAAEESDEKSAQESEECVANRLMLLRKKLPLLEYAEEYDERVAKRAKSLDMEWKEYNFSPEWLAERKKRLRSMEAVYAVPERPYPERPYPEGFDEVD